MNWRILISTIVYALSAYPSMGQNYSNESARVINQSSNGLAYPSSSYIGPGTMSKTAQQGAGYVPQSNPALPKVNRGAYFGTPGDNLYSGNPDLAQPPKTKSQRTVRFIYKETPKEIPNTYTPDPNIPMTYSDFKAEPPVSEDKTIPINPNNVNQINK